RRALLLVGSLRALSSLVLLRRINGQWLCAGLKSPTPRPIRHTKDNIGVEVCGSRVVRRAATFFGAPSTVSLPFLSASLRSQAAFAVESMPDIIQLGDPGGIDADSAEAGNERKGQ